MDQPTADVLKATVNYISLAALLVGVVYSVAKHLYLAHKSDNETSVEKFNSANATYTERFAALQKLTSDPNFKEYMQKRIDLTKELLGDEKLKEDYMNACKSRYDNYYSSDFVIHVNDIVDNTLGENLKLNTILTPEANDSE